MKPRRQVPPYLPISRIGLMTCGSSGTRCSTGGSFPALTSSASIGASPNLAGRFDSVWRSGAFDLADQVRTELRLRLARGGMAASAGLAAAAERCSAGAAGFAASAGFALGWLGGGRGGRRRPARPASSRRLGGGRRWRAGREQADTGYPESDAQESTARHSTPIAISSTPLGSERRPPLAARSDPARSRHRQVHQRWMASSVASRNSTRSARSARVRRPACDIGPTPKTPPRVWRLRGIRSPRRRRRGSRSARERQLLK